MLKLDKFCANWGWAGIPPKVDDGDEIDGEPGIEEPGGGEAPQEFPDILKVKVSIIALNIRRGPGTDNPIIGLLQNGETVDVIEMME